jgi:hypothetical protein
VYLTFKKFAVFKEGEGEFLLKYTAVSIGIFREGTHRYASHITIYSVGVLF